MSNEMKITSAMQQGARVLVQADQTFEVRGVLIGRTDKTVSIFEGPLINVYDPLGERLSSIEIQ